MRPSKQPASSIITRGTLIVIALALATFAARPAAAWGPDGYRIVCAIAWDELTPASQDRVKLLLNIETRAEFAEACNWADAYTAYHKETVGWHFVNVPTGATAVDAKRDCPKPTSCVVTQIQSDLVRLHKSNKSDKSATLRFLAHFIGDVHQPLHVSYAADRGGNDIKVLAFGKATNLHATWDIDLIEHDGRPWQQIADDLHAAVTPTQREEWGESTPVMWADESLAITRAPATGYLSHATTVDDAYARENMPVVLMRLQQAGIRLGATLNTVLR